MGTKVRQCVWFNRIFDLQKYKNGQALYYACTLFAFLAGACTGCVGVMRWGGRAAALGMPMLLFARILLFLSKREKVTRVQEKTKRS